MNNSVHKISVDYHDKVKLTQAVLQITAMLDMYQAELARVLGIRCGDIGNFQKSATYIVVDSDAWRQAVLLVQFYNQLYDHCNGDAVAMRHWLRRDNSELGGVPLLLIVDDQQLARVVSRLES